MTKGRVVGVCSSSICGTGKKNIGEGYLQKDFGLVGDAHAGGDRQVSLLLTEYTETVAKELEIDIKPGDFAENITVQGIKPGDITIGTLLQVGESLLEVVEIGKKSNEPHTFSFQGMALLFDIGIFCRVVKSGKVRVEDEVRIISS